MFRPPYLQPGDKVAIVSPAGAIAEEYITTGVEVLRSWELVPIIGPHANASYGYLQEPTHNAYRTCNGH